MKRSFVALTLASILGLVAGAIDPPIEWTNHLQFDSGWKACWTTADPEWLTMEISAPVTGYVAVGMSPNGAMQGSDIIMGWVDSSGDPQIKDLYALENSAPLEDAKQDVELLGAEESGDGTVIRFRRKWNTCDKQHDYKITNDTVKVIWAFSDSDPDPNSFNPTYHGDKRGVQNQYLKAQATDTKFPDDENLDPHIKFFDIAVENYQVPTASTTYACFIMKYPQFDKKNHMIGWRPIIEEANKPRVHHFVVFECVVPDGDTHSVFKPHLGRSEICYNPNMPVAWGQYCWTVPIVWTLGQEGEMLPEHLGIAMHEEHGGATYFMFEVHYDNPEHIEFVDNSGIRVYHTDQLRENELTCATIGTRFTSFLFVPPGQENYRVVGGCTPECTSKAFPPEGIKATHVVLHSHSVAKKAVLRHIRDGKELPPIAIDNNYDLNYQQGRVISPERLILPGDTLIMMCEYNTTKKKEPVYGDLTTEDSEMCHAFLFYYPRVETFASCQHEVEFYEFLNALGIEEVEGKVLDIVGLPYQPKENELHEPHDEGMLLLWQNMSMNSFEYMNIVKPEHLRGSTVKDVIDKTPWGANNAELGRQLNKRLLNGKYYAICTGVGRSRIPLEKYIINLPRFRRYREFDATCGVEE